MKVLLVLGYSLPTQQALWEEVAKLGPDVHAAYSPDAPSWAPGSSVRPSFGTCHELEVRRLRGDRETWMAYRGLGTLIRRLRPDLIHVLHEPWSIVASQVITVRTGLVVTHGWENLWDQGGAVERQLRHVTATRNLRNLSGFACANTSGITWARRWGLRFATPTLVVSPDLPRLERFTSSEARRSAGRSRLGVDAGFVVGYVGRLVPEKGIAWLLESWRAADLGRDAELLFAGAGPMEDEIRRAATADRRVRSLGSVGLAHVPELMAALDVLVLPSLTTRDWCEQFGRVITEAMASGVPVIASDSGAIPEVVGDAGLLVSEGSVVQLSAALERLARDRDLALRLRGAGLARASTCFSPSHQAVRVEAFWNEIADAAPRLQQARRRPFPAQPNPRWHDA